LIAAEHFSRPGFISIIKQSLNNGHYGGLAFVIGVSASDISLVAGKQYIYPAL